MKNFCITVTHPIFVRIDIVINKNRPLFIAHQITQRLKYLEPMEVISQVCQDGHEQMIPFIGSNKGYGGAYVIPESDLYILIDGSPLPSIEKELFRKWLVGSILPAVKYQYYGKQTLD